MRFFSLSKSLLFYRYIVFKNVSTKKTLFPDVPKLKKVVKRKNTKKIESYNDESVLIEENEISKIGSLIEKLDTKIKEVGFDLKKDDSKIVNFSDIIDKAESLSKKNKFPNLLNSFDLYIFNEFESMNVGLKSLIENNLPNGYPNIEFNMKADVVIINIANIENISLPLDVINKIQSKFKGNSKEDTIIKLFIDGACKEKSRKGYIGVMCLIDENTLFSIKGNVGETNTNNVCEYMALMYGLILCKLINIEKGLTIITDSQLLEKQIKKEYKLKTPHILLLNKMILDLLKYFPNHEIIHVLRENNKDADFLANQAVFLQEKSLNINF